MSLTKQITAQIFIRYDWKKDAGKKLDGSQIFSGMYFFHSFFLSGVFWPDRLNYTLQILTRLLSDSTKTVFF